MLKEYQVQVKERYWGGLCGTGTLVDWFFPLKQGQRNSVWYIYWAESHLQLVTKSWRSPQWSCRFMGWDANFGRRCKHHYYSFKYFAVSDWLKSHTYMYNHYNQLLLPKFGRILRYWTDDVNCAAKLTDCCIEKTWGQDWVVLVVKANWQSSFYSFQGKILSKNIARTARQEMDDIC